MARSGLLPGRARRSSRCALEPAGATTEALGLAGLLAARSRDGRGSSGRARRRNGALLHAGGIRIASGRGGVLSLGHAVRVDDLAALRESEGHGVSVVPEGVVVGFHAGVTVGEGLLVEVRIIPKLLHLGVTGSRADIVVNLVVLLVKEVVEHCHRSAHLRVRICGRVGGRRRRQSQTTTGPGSSQRLGLGKLASEDDGLGHDIPRSCCSMGERSNVSLSSALLLGRVMSESLKVALNQILILVGGVALTILTLRDLIGFIDLGLMIINGINLANLDVCSDTSVDREGLGIGAEEI